MTRYKVTVYTRTPWHPGTPQTEVDSFTFSSDLPRVKDDTESSAYGVAFETAYLRLIKSTPLPFTFSILMSNANPDASGDYLMTASPWYTARTKAA